MVLPKIAKNIIIKKLETEQQNMYRNLFLIIGWHKIMDV